MSDAHPSGPLYSILDVAPVAPGGCPRTALTWTVEAAQVADRLGYHRFWVGEHHADPLIAASSPPVLVAHLAAVTGRIRIGSGGVMLINHVPFVVAEQFALLDALHPGRIDLGIGRGPGGSPALAHVLRRRVDAGATFVDDLDDLLAHLSPTGEGPRVSPVGSPAVHLLAGGEPGALLAADRGLPVVLGHHVAPAGTRGAAVAYRAAHPTGRVLVSVGVTSADTDAAAHDELRRYVSAKRRTDVGDPAVRTLVDTVVDSGAVLVGAPHTVRAGLTALYADTGCDELMVVPHTLGGPERLHVVEACGPVSGE